MVESDIRTEEPTAGHPEGPTVDDSSQYEAFDFDLGATDDEGLPADARPTTTIIINGQEVHAFQPDAEASRLAVSVTLERKNRQAASMLAALNRGLDVYNPP